MVSNAPTVNIKAALAALYLVGEVAFFRPIAERDTPSGTLAVDFFLSGERGLATAMVSSVLLLVSWIATGWVYDRMRAPSTFPGTSQ